MGSSWATAGVGAGVRVIVKVWLGGPKLFSVTGPKLLAAPLGLYVEPPKKSSPPKPSPSPSSEFSSGTGGGHSTCY